MHTDDQARLLGHLETAVALRNGRRTALSRLLADCVDLLRPDDPVTFEVEFHLDALLAASGPAEESVERWRDLHDRMLPILGVGHPLLLRTRSVHAISLRYRDDEGDADEAVSLSREILALREKNDGVHAYLTSLARTNLAVALRNRGTATDLAEAHAIAEAEAEHRSRVYGGDHAFSWVPWGVLADVLLDQSELYDDPSLAVRALELAETVADLRLARFGRIDPQTVLARRRHGRALLLLSRRREAADLLERVRLVERLSGTDGEGDTEELLSRALDDPALALEAARTALDRHLRRYGPRSRRVAQARAALAGLARNPSDVL